MKLKAVLDSLDGLDENLKGLYVKRADGKYELDAEIEEHSGVRGMRSALEKQKGESKTAREQLRAFLSKLGIDQPDEAEEVLSELLTLKSEADKGRHKKMIDEGKVEDLLNERTAKMKADYEKQLKALGDDTTRLRAIAERALVDNAISAAAVKAGVRASAMQDILLRGKSVFKLDGEKVVAMEGERELFGKDGKGLGMDEWMEGLRENAAHLFEPSKGGGASGSGSQSGAAGAFTLTRDAARDPAKYRATKEAAEKAGQSVTILQ